MPIRKFIGRHYDEYRTELSYQRNKVWNKDTKLKLLESLFLGRHINSIIVNRITNGKHTYNNVIDGKNRLCTILEFLEGKIKYIFKFDDCEQELSFKNLKELSQQPGKYQNDYIALYDKIEELEIPLAIYRDLSFDREIEEFGRQNMGVKLNKQERLFCERPKLKYLMDNIWKYYTNDFIKSIWENDNRCHNIQWLTYFFHLWYGPELKNTTINCDLQISTNDNEKIFLTNFNNIISPYINDAPRNIGDDAHDKPMVEKILKSIKVSNNKNKEDLLYDKVMDIINVFNIVEKILGSNNNINKAKLTSSQRIFDVIVFIKYLCDIRQETHAYILDNISFWKDIILEYLSFKAKDPKFAGANSIHATYNKIRMSVLIDIYDKYVNKHFHDTGIKNLSFPLKVRTFLLEMSKKYNWKCPYYPDYDLSTKGEVNHYPPKCKTSEFVPILISQKANRRISDSTINDPIIDFNPMFEFYKTCYENIKNEIPNEIKNYFKPIDSLNNI